MWKVIRNIHYLKLVGLGSAFSALVRSGLLIQSTETACSCFDRKHICSAWIANTRYNQRNFKLSRNRYKPDTNPVSLEASGLKSLHFFCDFPVSHLHLPQVPMNTTLGIFEQYIRLNKMKMNVVHPH